MRVPLSWLRDYVALDMPVEDAAARLDVSTAVVAAMERIGVPDVDGNFGLFRVGKVLEAGKHPNADRLQLCKVDVGGPAAVPDRLRGVELRRGRDRRGRASRRDAPRRPRARAEGAPGRGLRGDDPLRARARAGQGTTPGSSSSGCARPACPSATCSPSRTSCSTSRSPATGRTCSPSTASREVAALFELELAPARPRA